MKGEAYELHGVFPAVSVSTEGRDGTRMVTMMERPGGDGDPYGGWSQADMLVDVEVSGVPDGRDLAPEDHPAFGFEDDGLYAVYTAGDTVTVAHHGEP
jgi:hypothetical protein